MLKALFVGIVKLPDVCAGQVAQLVTALSVYQFKEVLTSSYNSWRLSYVEQMARSGNFHLLSGLLF